MGGNEQGDGAQHPGDEDDDARWFAAEVLTHRHADGVEQLTNREGQPRLSRQCPRNQGRQEEADSDGDGTPDDQGQGSLAPVALGHQRVELIAGQPQDHQADHRADEGQSWLPDSAAQFQTLDTGAEVVQQEVAAEHHDHGRLEHQQRAEGHPLAPVHARGHEPQQNTPGEVRDGWQRNDLCQEAHHGTVAPEERDE